MPTPDLHDAVDDIVEQRWQQSEDEYARSAAGRVDIWTARLSARAKLEWRVFREWMRWKLADEHRDPASPATVQYSAALVGAAAVAAMLGEMTRADALVARANALRVVIDGRRAHFFLLDDEERGPMFRMSQDEEDEK